MKSIENNPNIGVLGGADYQEVSDRVKGFCGSIVYHPDDYRNHLETHVMVLMNEFNPSRIIDRALVREGVDIKKAIRDTDLKLEAEVSLGGQWEGYEWLMFGYNGPGRRLSQDTIVKMEDLVYHAAQGSYIPLRKMPVDFSLECISGQDLPVCDIGSLVSIFTDSFDDYLTPMTDPEYLRGWIMDPSTLPFVVRNDKNQIVGVASGDLGEVTFDNRTFRFMEIGDSASDPAYRELGLNRIIKHKLISEAKLRGFDSIHTETRACWGNPNFGNARNGMIYCGLLPSNCMIRGPEDIPESLDPDLEDWARKYGSLNIWALTPAFPTWNMF